jgi:hypothetical protein
MGYYENKKLDEWFLSLPSGTLIQTGGIDYQTQYKNIRQWLENTIYNEVQAGALFAEVKAKKSEIYLNKHGKEHVDCVIMRATKLIENSCRLEPYEVYILLVAILLHDAGNIFGRNNHEEMCQKVLFGEKGLGNIAGRESTEKTIIFKIAKAHSGSEDRISQLQPHVDLYGTTVRKRLLAAILRLSDELADDRTRASRFALEMGKLNGSKIYHAYSNSLASCKLEGTDIKLHYELTRQDVEKQYSQGKEKKYLVDYIYERIVKMNLETKYCTRYINQHTGNSPIARRICARIDFYENFSQNEPEKVILDPIDFELEETGYPEMPKGGISALCPKLTNFTGRAIKRKIRPQLGRLFS